MEKIKFKQRRKRFFNFCLVMTLICACLIPMGAFAKDWKYYGSGSSWYGEGDVVLTGNTIVQPGDTITVRDLAPYTSTYITYYGYDYNGYNGEALDEDRSPEMVNKAYDFKFTVKEYTGTDAELFRGWEFLVGYESGGTGGSHLKWGKLRAVKYTESTIDYQLNGGTNANTNPVSYYEGKDVTTALADATKDNCRFAGWYTDPDFAEDSRVTEITKDTSGNLILYARFIPVHNITYELDGGVNGAGNPASYEEGTGVSAFADAAKDGYTFEGWYSDAAYTKKVTEISAAETGDVILYAKFTVVPRVYNITYELDGGVNGAGNPASYEEGTGVSAFADAAKDGYTFEGWYSDAAYTKKVTEISADQTGDIILYAKFITEEKEQSVKVEEPVADKTQSPKTGDTTDVMPILVLVIISGAGLAVIEQKRKKQL